MQQEAPEKLLDWESHSALLVLVCRVTPPECDLAVSQGEQPVIGDRHPVRVAAEISQGVLSSAERPFAIYDPLRTIRLADERGEHLRGSERFQAAVETQLATLKRLLESLGEFAAEDFLQHGHRQEEARLG